MKKRATLIAILAVVVWASVGAFVSADDFVVSITNHLDIEVMVSIYEQDGPEPKFPCEDFILNLAPGDTIYVHDRDLRSCRVSDEFIVAVFQFNVRRDNPIYPETGLIVPELIQRYENVKRGSHVDIVKTW